MLTNAQREVLELVENDDMKFIRLAFCDMFGVQKNLSIQASELPRAFETGIPFDASAITGFQGAAPSDLFLYPDPDSMVVLPWRPSHNGVARFFCSIRNADGSPFSGDCRQYLKDTIEMCAEERLYCEFGAECEFYLFRCDENGQPTVFPIDQAGYLDIAPLDRGENVRREICMTLESMGIQPESSHHEQGAGQNEVDFQKSDPLQAADHVTTFKQVVSTIAARNGLFASFRPKPLPNAPGNGFHINLSLSYQHQQLCPEHTVFRAFMAGLLDHAAELTRVCNPVTESFIRLGKEQAPAYISWSSENRSQLIRIPAGEKKLEYRAPDAAVNPYLAFALVLRAGLDGISRGLTPPPPCNANLINAPKEALKQYAALPQTPVEAIRMMKESSFMRSALPEHIFAAYTA